MIEYPLPAPTINRSLKSGVPFEPLQMAHPLGAVEPVYIKIIPVTNKLELAKRASGIVPEVKSAAE